MNFRKFNWPIWAGFLLTLAAAYSYPFIFVRWPVTRDFPWVNLLLFGMAIVLLYVGVRRAFASGRGTISKIGSSILAILSVGILSLFIFGAFIMARRLPASHGAPQVGQKAPDFSLADTNNKMVSLSELLSTPTKGARPKGVVLIFYRGYW
jgi:hypothetical protein